MTGSKCANRINGAIAATGGRLTDQSFDVVDQMCREFAAIQTRSEIASFRLNRDSVGALMYYSARCAVEAVRYQVPDRVVHGLTAVVMENGSLDIRDSIRILAELFHSASILEMDTVALFSRFAGLAANDELAAAIRRFSLPAGSATVGLERFGLRTIGEGAEFKYVDDDFPRAVRMYLKAPGLTFSQRLGFLRMLRRQNPEQWRNWRRTASRNSSDSARRD